MFLRAKITAPIVPGWMVPRPRLQDRIDEGTAGPLTVVTGPPGAGKTMAVASWAAARPSPVAWITLDHYDSNPKVFWATVVAALRNAGVTLRRVSAAPAGRPALTTFSCSGSRRNWPRRTRRWRWSSTIFTWWPTLG